MVVSKVQAMLACQVSAETFTQAYDSNWEEKGRTGYKPKINPIHTFSGANSDLTMYFAGASMLVPASLVSEPPL